MTRCDPSAVRGLRTSKYLIFPLHGALLKPLAYAPRIGGT